MNLESVYGFTQETTSDILWDLLDERTPEQSISHKGMPTNDEHLSFIASKPYQAWYFIFASDDIVGSIYLSKRGEIGISIFKEYWGKGYGKQAVKMLMEMNSGPFYANINPGNTPSIKLFKNLGFKHIQQTYVHSC